LNVAYCNRGAFPGQSSWPLWVDLGSTRSALELTKWADCQCIFGAVPAWFFFSLLCDRVGELDVLNPSGKEGFSAYKQSKLCNFLFTYELHRRFSERRLYSFCVDPGEVNTDITRNFPFSSAIKALLKFFPGRKSADEVFRFFNCVLTLQAAASIQQLCEAGTETASLFSGKLVRYGEVLSFSTAGAAAFCDHAFTRQR
jgi:NAD(P)-dependent dehydrogenase (short-subunit alcohol dehydrogenase family)